MKKLPKTLLTNLLFIVLLTGGIIIFSNSYGQYDKQKVIRRTAYRTARKTGQVKNTFTGNIKVVTSVPTGCITKEIAGTCYQYHSGIYFKPFFYGTKVIYQIVDLQHD